MAEKQGRLNQVGVSTDGGSNYTNLDSLVDATFNAESSEIETTDRGDGQWRSFLLGHSGASIDLTCNWDVADTEIIDLLDAWFAQTKLDFRWRFDEVAGEREFTAEGYVMTFTPTAPGADGQTVGITLRLTGTITKATQV